MFAKLKDEKPIVKPYFLDLPEQSGSVQKMPHSATSATFREAISAELTENVRCFWKTRKRRWTECSRVRIAGSSDVVPELTWRAKPQSNLQSRVF